MVLLTWKDPQTHYWTFKVHFKRAKSKKQSHFGLVSFELPFENSRFRSQFLQAFRALDFFFVSGILSGTSTRECSCLFSSLLISVTTKWRKILRKNIFVGSNFRNKTWFLNRHYGVINLFFSQFISSHVLWLCPWMWFWITPASESLFILFLSSLSFFSPTVPFQIVHRFSGQDIKSNPYSITNRTLWAFPFIWS